MSKNDCLKIKLKKNKKINNKTITPKAVKLRLKYIRFNEKSKPLANKLEYKIIKEALILGLREELNHNETMKETLCEYLDDVNRLKERVKKNKEEVEDNCNQLKQEFNDRFKIIENFEKQIGLLNEEKKEIIRTNNEIIAMKSKTTQSLKNQLNKIQEDTNEQWVVIDDLKEKILGLEKKLNNLNNEFDLIIIEEEKKYKQLLADYLILAEKCEYYQIEYNKYDKYPEEKLKDDLNLFDTTKKNDLLTEENLKIELAEKTFVRDKLINSINNLHKQINIIEEKQKEIKEKEKLYGKPLSSRDIKKKNKNKNKKNNLTVNTISNTNTYMNTNYTNSSIKKRAKTISNRFKK
jgi:hypothetical protein